MSSEFIENRISTSTLRSGTKANCMFVLGVLSTFILLFNIKVGGISMFKYIALGFGTYIGWKNHGKLKRSTFKYEYAAPCPSGSGKLLFPLRSAFRFHPDRAAA